MEQRFKGKVALVTGAAKGIGFAAAKRLAAEGADVALNDINAEGAEEAVAAIRAAGGNASAFPADMSSGVAIRRMFTQVREAFGEVDILVNNAGGSCRALGRFVSFLEQSEADLDWEIAVNLKSAILCCQEAIPMMEKRKYGRILNLSSICGTVGMPDIPVYAATKGAIVSLTKTLAMMYGEQGVTVNAVAPAAVATRPGMEALGAATYLKRACSGDEVANLICFLASDDAAFITGQTYVIDGGRTLGPRSKA